MLEDEEEEIHVPINNDLERRIADAFEVFDHAGNKTVDVREVATIVRALGCCPTEAEIQEILMAVENPESPGSVHLSNFLPHMSQIITEHKYQPASPAQLLEAFQVLDNEGKGFLTKERISTLMTQDGEPFTQDELDEMLEIAIDPHTQTVPYEYYINQLMHEPEGEKDIYKLADRVLEENPPPPPPPPPRRLSEFLHDLSVPEF
ncbi:dynein regulatory complex protein 8 isoform X1 [Tribolium castaneum]|uniref:Calmodulin-like Protein n=1 Tax=Tribolium castaneum TaxID=7070 RepID=D6WH45_TRICA|nr:PREDICTED: EF-hand calcium-binding domain-containing protein 2 isoform X1 [Tribolium castaneum]EEZ99756.1 Calmodulin-like Protein [Tribolium castaneum]|eukprot:XP_015834047.1 PREDICTED: EF-hand calcium-binding domain-containing protein 2 isoform X1 [Tribolium castaneum]